MWRLSSLVQYTKSWSRATSLRPPLRSASCRTGWSLHKGDLQIRTPYWHGCWGCVLAGQMDVKKIFVRVQHHAAWLGRALFCPTLVLADHLVVAHSGRKVDDPACVAFDKRAHRFKVNNSPVSRSVTVSYLCNSNAAQRTLATMGVLSLPCA
jgi:hypothetical protein